jgi:hypothetical protein
MKVIVWEPELGTYGIELTRRNLETLLAKLDNPDSLRTLVFTGDHGQVIAVRAVENDEHYTERPAGLMAEDIPGFWGSSGEYHSTDAIVGE